MSSTLIWIDQISIDQQNLSERNHQVQLMGDIFSNAVEVVVWLGLSLPDCISVESVAAFHRSTGEAADGKPREQEHRRPPGEKLRCPICKYYRYSDSAWVERSWPINLFELEYWTRLWIVQEVALAQHITFFLGHEQISAATVLTYTGLINPSCTVKRVRVMLGELHLASRPEFSLKGLLQGFNPAMLACTDPRDLVFGLVGLLRPSDRVEVDYSLGHEEVFGLLLDRVLLTQDFQWDRDETITNLAALEPRLGLPLHWRVSLESMGYPSRSLKICLLNFLKRLRDLQEEGSMKSVWSTSPMRSMIPAAVPLISDPRSPDIDPSHMPAFEDEDHLESLYRKKYEELQAKDRRRTPLGGLFGKVRRQTEHPRPPDAQQGSRKP